MTRGRAACQATLCATLLAGLTGTSSAQEVVRLPGEDRWLQAEFEDIYRIGSQTGEDWEQFGNIQRVAFAFSD